jgi:DNA-binding CsgD family transcriptional regulator
MTAPLTTLTATEPPYAGDRLTRTLSTFRAHGRMDMAFGGRTLPGRNAVEISGLSGARTRSLARLVVHHGSGLGGKALALNRPVSVTCYHDARGITHHYDAQVRDEALETVVALPIVVDGRARMVVYLGSRTRVGLGDRWFDDFLPLVRGLERDIEVDDEVSRRLTRLRPAPTVEPGALTRADVADICHELTDLAAGVADEALRERIERLRARVEEPSRRSTAPTVDLAPRELAVLEQVAAGCSNREAADNLGLLTSTVKSYLKTAMRKLHASNRVQAIIAAREAGLLT